MTVTSLFLSDGESTDASRAPKRRDGTEFPAQCGSLLHRTPKTKGAPKSALCDIAEWNVACDQ
ncbi:hypothetical protein [Pseudoxanthomonas sp.]|uniref:hypothetical protein n=1 Tax=Pseudoxanthomonas sp. TaxID=1871049 RepID=UPI003F8146F0